MEKLNIDNYLDDPCPNFRIESEFIKHKTIHVIHPDEWICSQIYDTGDTAPLSQLVAHKDTTLDVMSLDYKQFVSEEIEDEELMEFKVRKLI